MSAAGQPIVIVGSMAFDDLEFPRPIVDPSGENNTMTAVISSQPLLRSR